MKLLIGLLFIAVVVYISSLNWRHTIKAVLIILVVEGALRKWVLPQASEMIYFLKDFIILGAYVGFFTSKESFSIKSHLIINLLTFFVVGWCIFQAFNPSLGSPLVGIFGLKSYLLYIPLIWVIPNLFRSEEELHRFLRLYLLLVIPIGILGIAQFSSPASSLLNDYASDEATGGVATFGVTSGVRVTGTFSYISGYAVYLLVCFGLLIPLLSINQTWWWRWVFIIELLLVTVNMFMTGSRGPVIASVLFLLSYLGAKGLTQPTSALHFTRKLLIPAIVVSVAAFIWFQPAINAFWLRTANNQDVSGRILSSFVEPLEFIKHKELDGYGAGATQAGTLALRQALDLPGGELIPTYYESEMGRVVLELGPFGFLVWYGLRISIAIGLWLTFRKLKRPFLRELALAAFLIQAIQINGHLVFHHTFSVYYWFLSSFIFLLPRLEQVENWCRERQLLQQNVSSTYITGSPHQ